MQPVQRTPWRNSLTAAYVLAVIVFIGWFIASELPRVSHFLAKVSPLRSAIALLAALLYFGLAGLLWVRLQRKISAGDPQPMNAAEWLHIFMIGYLGRYIPGKVPMVLGRLLFLVPKGYTKTSVISAASYEIVFSMIGMGLAGGFCALLIPSWVGSRLSTALLIVAAGSSLIFGPTVLRWLITKTAHRLPQIAALKANLLTSREMARFLIQYTLLGFLFGIAFYAFWFACNLNSDWDSIAIAVAAINSASIVGIVSVFAPSGLGVRETALVYLLTTWGNIDLADATLLSISYRIFLISAEIIFFTAVFLIRKAIKS